MLEARKENKVYKIDEAQKDRYLKEGFDIYKNGAVVEYTPLKTIKYSEHLKEMAKVIAEKDNQIKDLMEMTNDTVSVPEVSEDVTTLLKNYAEAKGIDIGSCSAASGILEKIVKAEKQEE